MTEKPTDQAEPPAVDEGADEHGELVESTSFPSVGVGASAGGLEALTQLHKALPADTGVALLLRHSGHEVRTAPDGPGALEAALDFRPDVALLDIGLPGSDGIELAKRTRQQPALQKVVLVGVTGFGRESDRRHDQESGFDHFLVKPTDFETVQEIFASVSERTTLRGESGTR